MLGAMAESARRISIAGWLAGYQRSWLRPDLIAGLSLAAYAIPVSMAYASLAGLPPESGLYCYLLGGAAYALLGSSRQLAIGPTSAIAMLVGATLGPLTAGDPERHAVYAAFTALFVAAIALLAWLFRLGGIVQFVSETVLSGFKIGAALVIASTQLPKLFGVAASGSNFFERIAHLIGQLGAIHLPSLLLGLAALGVLALGEGLLRGRPVVLLVVVASILVMTFTGLAERGVAVVGELPSGLPALGIQRGQLADVQALLPLALACFLLAFVEGVSTARAFALEHGYAVDTERELLATAAANLAAGFGQGFPVAGGMSQSAVNGKAGARTPAALLVASGAIALVLIFLTEAFRMLPQPVLAAVVLVAVYGMIDFKELRHLRRVSRFDYRVALVALLGVLAFGILDGVLLASVFSLVMLVRRAASPATAVLGRLPDTDQFGDLARHPEAESLPGVLVFRLQAGLLYFNAEYVRESLLAAVRAEGRPIDLVVFDLSAALVDLGGARMLGRLREQLASQGTLLKLAQARNDVRALLQGEGLDSLLVSVDRKDDVADVVSALGRPVLVV
ncbi:MAG: SulP family inorganic anion transporter [Candidatus Limnocylindria bacterium]